MSELEATYMYLSIRGNFDPTVISSQITMKPWGERKKGEKCAERVLPRSSGVNFGKVEGRYECPDLDLMSAQLYSQLAPYREEFIALSKEISLKISCVTCLWMVHDLRVSTPPIGFGKEIIQFLGEMGATIDVDMYRDDEYIPSSS